MLQPSCCLHKCLSSLCTLFARLTHFPFFFWFSELKDRSDIDKCSSFKFLLPLLSPASSFINEMFVHKKTHAYLNTNDVNQKSTSVNCTSS